MSRMQGNLHVFSRTLDIAFLVILAGLPLIRGGLAHGIIVPAALLICTFGLLRLSIGWLQNGVPRLPVVPGVLSFLLFLWSAWMLWNSHSLYDPTFRVFVSLSSPFPDGPGSIDRALTTQALWTTAGWITAFFWSLALIQGRKLSWMLAALLASSALGVILAVLRQFGLHWPTVMASTENPKLAWGPFSYHGNAGSYLVFLWPLAAEAARLAFARRSRLRWLLAALTISLSLSLLLHPSRSAALIGAMLMIFWWLFRFRTSHFSHTWSKHPALLLIFLVCGGVFWTIYGNKWLERWSAMFEYGFSFRLRWEAWRAAWSLVEQQPVWGFGPGTFRYAFLDMPEQFPLLQGFTWRFLHNDYLQTYMEWGLPGTAFWLALALPALMGWLSCFFYCRRPEADPFAFAFCLAGAGLGLHAMVDFPLQVFSLQLLSACAIAVGWKQCLSPSH